MRVLLLCLALTLPACAILGPVEPVSTKKPTSAAEQAQYAVNEANLGLTAAANVVAGNVKDRIWTKTQAQPYLDKIRDYARQTDRAQELIRLGQFDAGKTQAEATKALILILHREIAAKAREVK